MRKLESRSALHESANAHVGGIHRTHGEGPLISVVTAVFNGEKYLRSCIESVIRQDYSKVEHIIIDGGSTDGSVSILRGYSDRLAFWISEPDRGIYDAWNKGIARATGDWICFLGADDEFLEGAVSAYVDLAQRHPDAEYLSSQIRWIHPSGYVRILGRPWSWPEFQKRMCTAHPGSMHRRILYERYGDYDVSYRTAADYEFLLRAQQRLKTAYMPVVTVMMRAGGASESSRALREAQRAKTMTGGRSALSAKLEFHIDNTKFQLRPLRRRVSMMLRGR